MQLQRLPHRHSQTERDDGKELFDLLHKAVLLQLGNPDSNDATIGAPIDTSRIDLRRRRTNIPRPTLLFPATIKTVSRMVLLALRLVIRYAGAIVTPLDISLLDVRR
jgi:hypothetical protein